MDFHAEFEKSCERFPDIIGIIFVDPDGENILYQNPSMEAFNVQLTGAKMNLLVRAFESAQVDGPPKTMEIRFTHHFLLYVRLLQDYSVSLVATNIRERARLAAHLEEIADKFNQEIV